MNYTSILILISLFYFIKASFSLAVPFSIDPRIIGGEAAIKGQFPWQAAINVERTGNSFWCGGSLISDKWIVTAGHCVKDSLKFTIALGSNLLVGQDPDRIVLESDQYILHEDYNSNSLANDIGLILLPKSVSLNGNIQPIGLDADEVNANTIVIVSGWGLTSDSNSEPSVNLNYVSLKTITDEECKNVYTFLNRGVVCAEGYSTSVQSTCEGDSGGPLITRILGEAVLVGIVSFGHPDGCESNNPVAFTRIHYHRNWIKEKTSV